MTQSRKQDVVRQTLVATIVALGLGCQTSRQYATRSQRDLESETPISAPAVIEQPTTTTARVSLTSYVQGEPTPGPSLATNDRESESSDSSPSTYTETLEDLEAWAATNNPSLRRLQQEAAAEWAKTGYVSQIPDPTIGTMFFTPPMDFVPDRQVADSQIMQMIPWLGRLDAEAQRTHLEALAAENMYEAERLRIVGELRANWFKLYVLNKQIETTLSDAGQLESLVRTANARVATGDAQPGDVLLATLELSALQEQLISYRQQLAATTAELNRLAGRDASMPIAPPAAIPSEFPDWNHAMLVQVARESQPELNAARLRTAATRWGIEVARLKRRPDFTFGVGWVVMDAPGSLMAGAGRDSVTLSVSANIPVWRPKYDAMTAEASSQHFAAHASEDEVAQRLDAMLLDLWEQAEASRKTIELYDTTILPQARQTFEADQKALVNNAVTFDRIIRDYRTVLGLELGYHRALGEHATSLARIRQVIGVDLAAPRESAEPVGH